MEVPIHLRGWLGARATFCYREVVKTTAYFEAIRKRPDRAVIQDTWIQWTVQHPLREAVQTDGRIRRWAAIAEANGRIRRVVLLADGETIHNAFFDRGFRP